MDLQIKPNAEIHEGAVLVISGPHKGRVGFYCLQNEQTYDMNNIVLCPRCKLTKSARNIFDSVLEIETGSYCESHRRALVENDLAVIYWDKPYEGDYSLIHPSELVPIPSTEYSRYERECKRDVGKALSRLMDVLGSLQKMDHAKTSDDSSFRFKFKLAESSQRQLIHEWIAQEHVRQWLHGDGLRNTHRGLDEFFGGSSWAQHWIAYDQDTPFAYLLTGNEGKDAITLDLFICDLNYLGKGLGVQMIHEFLMSQFPNKSEVLIDPEATNTRAIHVYEKAGFRTVGTFIAPWHPVLHYKMRLDMKELVQKHHKG